MSSFYADSVVSRKYDDSQMFTLDKFNRLQRNAGEVSDRYFFFLATIRCTEENDIFLEEIGVLGASKQSENICSLIQMQR